MPSIRTQLSNVKEYGRGDQYKTKKDAVEEAFSKLVTCLIMYKTAADSSDDEQVVPSGVETVLQLYNTGNSISDVIVRSLLIK
jgi:hypothetical protein